MTGAFTGLALILAGIGVFAVTAFLVSQRTHDIGVRVAIGARPAQAIGVVLRQCVPAPATGAALGLVMSLPLMSSLRAYLYEVLTGDWTAYAFAALTLGIVAGMALVVPVYRALRIDPVLALRYE